MYIETMPCGCPATKVKRMNEGKAKEILNSDNSFLFMGPDPNDDIAINTIYYDEKSLSCFWLSFVESEDGITITSEKQTDLLTGANTIVKIFKLGIPLTYGHGRPV